MITINEPQGSDGWKAVRSKYFTASEAPAASGVSKYMSRTELLRLKATGDAQEIDRHTQALFDCGHAAEAAARQIVEELLGDELFPVTGTLEVDGLPLLASFDGINMSGDVVWESKLYNADLARAIEANDIEPHYWFQLEQQLLVSGADRAYFTASDGTPERTVGMWYESVPERRAQLIAMWHQFAEDVENYQHVEVIPAAVAAPTMALPALSVQVNGEIQVIDNLKTFGERLSAFIEGLDKNPSDDQAFADAEAAIKTLGAAETALEAAKASALAQVATVDEMTRTVALYAGQARTTRLMLEKLVKSRKETIRIEIMQAGKDALAAHIASLNQRIGKPYMPIVPADFADVMKGKKTVSSLREAVNNELVRAKIEANEIADRIQVNLAVLQELASEHKFLFADTAQIIMKAPDDLTALVKMRIAEHKTAEERRLEAEREKIRKEEESRAEAKVRAEEQAKLAEAARAAKETAAAQVPAQPQSGAPSEARHPQPAPAAATQPQKPAVSMVKGAPRPTDDAIIAVIALHYRVHESKALEWICDMDLEAAGKRLVA